MSAIKIRKFGRVGFDITDVGFWDASLDVVRGRIEQYCELAGG
mgnify:CR=1 FL=1